MIEDRHIELNPRIFAGSAPLKKTQRWFIFGVIASAIAILLGLFLLIFNLVNPDFQVARGGIVGFYGFLPLTVYMFFHKSRDALEGKVAKSKRMATVIERNLEPGETVGFMGAELPKLLLPLRDRGIIFLTIEGAPANEALRIELIDESYYVARVLML